MQAIVPFDLDIKPCVDVVVLLRREAAAQQAVEGNSHVDQNDFDIMMRATAYLRSDSTSMHRSAEKDTWVAVKQCTIKMLESTAWQLVKLWLLALHCAGSRHH